MHISTNSTVLIIYCAMTSYLTAFMLRLLNKNKSAKAFFIAAFLINLSAIVVRWIEVNHVPMQTLFEVFLWIGALTYPISFFSRKYLNTDSVTFDTVLGFIVLFPAGFIFPYEPQHLPPALQCWMFTPHVAAYMLAYIFMVKAAVHAGQLLAQRRSVDTVMQLEQLSYHFACIGFPLLTLGLVLGCFWAKIAWGDYWSWDPKELWSLASWLAYLAYFHFRFIDSRRRPRVNAVVLIFAALVIIITLIWVNISKLFPGLHNYA